MSDDELDCDGTKDYPTRVTGTGKELLGWLKPGSSTGSSEEQSAGKGATDANTLNRRSYMLLAGGAAAAAVGGTAASNAVSASGTSVSQPDLYGYGGQDLQPSGQETTLLSIDQIEDSVTQTEENDERATAMEISPGTLVNATLETATVDWFVFEAGAGDPITVEYDRENDVGITGLILYGPDGSFKDKLYVGSGSVHTLTDLAEDSGEHFLQVIDVTDGAGEYSFAVWLQEEFEDDGADEEEDDEEQGDEEDSDADDGEEDDADADDSDDDDADEDGQQPYQGEYRTIPGRIRAQDFDEGGQGVAYYDTTEENQPGLYRPDEYVDIEESQDITDEYSVGYVSEGEWLEYTLDVSSGTYELSARVATEWDDVSFAVNLDGERLTTVDVSNTDGWYDWETITIDDIEIPDGGTSILRVEFLTGGTNLNWLEFEPVSDDSEFVDEDGQQPYQGDPQTVPGRIRAQDFDEGGQGVAYYDTTEENQPGHYRPDEYVDIEESQDTTDEYSIGFVSEGEWLEYTLDVDPGTYELSARVATEWDDVSFAVDFEDDRIATVDVPNTNGWYDWETVSAGTVEIPDGGAATIRVEFTTGGTNLNWLEFEPVSDDDDDGDDEKIGFGQGPYGGTDA